MQTIQPVRLLFKALLFFCVFDLLFINFQSAIFQYQIYNHIVDGRLRLPYAQPQLEKIAHSISVYEEMDAMFDSHYISSVLEKPADEFRVLFLGDSSIWGAGVLPQDALPGQINSLALTTCDNKHVVAYNLAFPSLYVMKDLLILQKAIEYQPDLIVWGVTLKSLENSNVNASLFLPAYSNSALYLIKQYKLNIPTDTLKPQTVWNQTLFSKRVIMKKLLFLEEDSLPWIATGLDYDTFSSTQIQYGNDIVTESKYINHSSEIKPSNLMLNIMKAGDDLAGRVPVLVLNEPIFVANGKNSDRYYNNYYARQTYDQYRQILSSWAKNNNQPYFDAWNILPRTVFTNTPLHISAGGESQLASYLEPEIMKLSCP